MILSVGLLNKAAEYTTLGNHIWFGELVGNVVDKFKNEKIKRWLNQMSFSKLLVCIDCHTFWLTMITGSIFNLLLSTTNLEFLLYSLFITLPISFIGFLNSLGKNAKTQK